MGSTFCLVFLDNEFSYAVKIGPAVDHWNNKLGFAVASKKGGK